GGPRFRAAAASRKRRPPRCAASVLSARHAPAANSGMSAAPDVLVVGAGPVGLTIAGERLRPGVACPLVGKSPARTDKSKALVLWPRTLELLDRAGAVEPFLATGMRVVRARIFGNRAPLAELAFDGIPTPYPFALMLPQSETERLLEAQLGALGG